MIIINNDCYYYYFLGGLYDFSGEWAFKIGLPAKSAISGCIYIVVPNRMGISIYSPRFYRKIILKNNNNNFKE